MLTRRNLTLSHPQLLSDGPVLRRETLENSLLAEQLLEAAQAEAEALLVSARQEAERMGEEVQAQARVEVWCQADALLDDWQQQRQQMWVHIIATAETLVGQALQKLLGEQPDKARIRAMLHHLMATQTQEQVGVLHTHPDWLETTALQLQQAQACWTLRADPQLAPDSLLLRTELGDFSFSWSCLAEALWSQPDSVAH
ncbi:type III secretion system stator protein SctL [Pseudomonas sp. 22526]|uniref:type III secretion system stator protein SctL n=1 Tax=Pseudomonas sp. 22526 TaxID=3453937 RepID=UPI003F85D082